MTLPSLPILVEPPLASAIAATTQLLGRLKIDFACVGEVALAAWLGRTARPASLDLLALTSTDRSRNLPMMASNNGFRVEREEVEAAEELDLLPMHFLLPEGEIRVHVLMATNALYGRMIRDAVDAEVGGLPIRVINAEDLALLLTMADGEEAGNDRAELIEKSGPGFDGERFNRKLRSIGLGERELG